MRKTLREGQTQEEAQKEVQRAQERRARRAALRATNDEKSRELNGAWKVAEE